MQEQLSTPGATDLAVRFAVLSEKKRQLDKALRAVRAAMDDIEEPLMQALVAENVHQLKVETPDGNMFTVFCRAQMWARVKEGIEPIDVVRELERVDLEGLVSLNTSRLSALVRDLATTGDALPGKLAEMLESYEKVSVRTRSAS